MSSLYELTDRWAALLDLACDTSDDDGRISPEFVELLAAIEGSIDEKLQAYWRMMKNLDAQHAAFENEAKRLAAKAKALDQHYEYLRANVKDTLDKKGVLKWEQGVAKFRIQKNSTPSVVIDDEPAIPADYYVQPPPQLDKRFIVEAIKSGKTVPGAHLEVGSHVRL